ncbi:uncharacterized protein BXZ73DRAFT_108989 [Epithele typhae]|uniref:uncharacterized protein n=1 Tax=Epithele typhae TaxID=378194 RepID=UPI002008716D|nr:uncharacterized protein BXZ73DRAFT_108989 [Epithele typhae]KAH9910445.1 hypothetical protein BXZ73DRAFT_108989 [Epithele typhae]
MVKHKSRNGISRKTVIYSHEETGPTRKELTQKEIAEKREETDRKIDEMLSGLSDAAQRAMKDVRGDPVEDPSDTIADVMMGIGEGDEDGWEAEDDSAPKDPAAEALRDLLNTRALNRKPADIRKWRQRLQVAHKKWTDLLPSITDAYLHWKHCGGSTSQEPSEYDFDIEVIDIDSLSDSVRVPREADQTTSEALICSGYLGITPEQPGMAIALKTLEWLRIIRLVKPSFSMEAFAKLACYKYKMPYHRRYGRAIIQAFDAYVMILEEVIARVNNQLGRTAENWRVTHGCCACGYKIQEEKPPTYVRKEVMDANNSLKRMATPGGRLQGDTRIWSCDYMLPREFVDTFANEVSRGQPHVAVPEGSVPINAGDATADADADDLIEDADPTATEGDPTDGAINSACASNWKAASADEKKRMWGIFEETGIFAMCCAHGRITWIADMVRSGELAKYPIAMVRKLLDTIPGPHIVGYDIGCTFKTTLARSSVGPDFAKSGSRCCVNAFHGYSHSYPCQLDNHPLGIAGMGLEDLETLERVFSDSNALAPVIRYASVYRRHALMTLFFRHRDEEKHTNLGEFLLNNYKQAINIINKTTPMLREALATMGVTTDQLEGFASAEREYFANLQDEAPRDIYTVEYVMALQELQATRNELDRTSVALRSTVPANYQFLTPSSGPTDYNAYAKSTRRLESRRRELTYKIDRLRADITEWEVALELNQSWTPTHPEYQTTLQYISTRKYQQALGRLQRLVVQRLFELHKLNLAQTAYKVRTQIAKNLQKRSKAIRAAVKAYNSAAAALTPPRPSLDWERVSHFSFVEEFALLNDTRNDLKGKVWAQPLAREAMRCGRRLARAHEEVERVHCEARRVLTSIHDEERHFKTVLWYMQSVGDSPVLREVAEHVIRRNANNAHILRHLNKLFALPGYMGETTPGTYSGPPREGAIPAEAIFVAARAHEAEETSSSASLLTGTFILAFPDASTRPSEMAVIMGTMGTMTVRTMGRTG